MFHWLRLILNRESRRGVAPSKTPPPPLLRKERGHRSKTLRGVRLFHKSQRGFSLVEIALAIAVAGVITGGITMTIFQVFDANARTSNHMTAVRQVQNAGYWVSHDAQMAQDIVTGDDPATPGVTEFLTLTWTDWDGTVNEVTYTIVDSELKRSHSVNGDTETSIIAEYIDPDNTNCKFARVGTFSLPDDTDVFTITGGAAVDNGTMTVIQGSVEATPQDGAAVAGGPDQVTIDTTSGAVAWETPAGAGTITVAATVASTWGEWTSTAGTATVAVTADEDGDATVTARGKLTFTVTATVQEQSETRIYEVIPRPG